MSEQEILDAITEVELLQVRYRVADGPRNQRERAANQELFATQQSLAKIRKVLYRMLDCI